jgi:adenine phosphoribosyltransferase
VDLASRVAGTLRDVPDFPRPGIIFKDITPVLADASLFSDIVSHFTDSQASNNIDVIAGIESRGFILGGAVAAAMRVGFAPLRKPGKLPCERLRV